LKTSTVRQADRHSTSASFKRLCSSLFFSSLLPLLSRGWRGTNIWSVCSFSSHCISQTEQKKETKKEKEEEKALEERMTNHMARQTDRKCHRSGQHSRAEQRRKCTETTEEEAKQKE